MSKEYVKKFGNKIVTKAVMRKFCQRPGARDKNGDVQYFTEQCHKDVCDVNKIIAKYDKEGLITHVTKFEAKFGDMTGADFKAANDMVTNAISMFQELPAEIRKRFDHTPEKLLKFMENPANRDEAIKLGLIHEMWTEQTDGLGEHVKEGDQEEIEPTQEP